MKKFTAKTELEFIDINGIKRIVKSQINSLNGNFMWWISDFPRMYVGRGSLSRMIIDINKRCKKL